MNSACHILAKYLIDTHGGFNEPGSSGTWPLYRAFMPDAPGLVADIACIYDTSPDLQGKRVVDGVLSKRNGIQIHLRSNGYDEGYEKLSDVVEDLAKVHGVLVTYDSTQYKIVNISVASDGIPIGQDEKKRYHFTANFLARIVKV
jgi:hypothetical protein